MKTQPDAQRSATGTEEAEPSTESSVGDRNDTWAELIKPVFMVDVLQCEHCGGRMKVVVVIGSPTATARNLECLGHYFPRAAPGASRFRHQLLVGSLLSVDVETQKDRCVSERRKTALNPPLAREILL